MQAYKVAFSILSKIFGAIFKHVDLLLTSTRLFFRKIACLAFVPVVDVIKGLEHVCELDEILFKKFNTLIKYFEQNYIGELKREGGIGRAGKSLAFHTRYGMLMIAALKICRGPTTSKVGTIHFKKQSNEIHQFTILLIRLS